jgi:hypothetical protein
LKAIFAVFALFIDMYSGFWKEIKSQLFFQGFGQQIDVQRNTFRYISLEWNSFSSLVHNSRQLMDMWKTQEHRLLLVHQGKAPPKFLLWKSTHGFD